jgi:hypothetical protein
MAGLGGFLAWLAQISLLITVPNSNTYKSNKYTSRLKQYKVQHNSTATYIHNYFTFLHLPPAQLVFMNVHSHISEFHTGELKGPAGHNTVHSFAEYQYFTNKI